MMSVLEGVWVDIPNTSKSKVGRNIQLDMPMQSIFNELKDWLENGYGSKLKTPDDHLSKSSKRRCVASVQMKVNASIHLDIPLQFIVS